MTDAELAAMEAMMRGYLFRSDERGMLAGQLMIAVAEIRQLRADLAEALDGWARCATCDVDDFETIDHECTLIEQMRARTR